MSTILQHKREAATFLATYTGAQGELIVDTTNNRVQVHDGATAGGWPATKFGDLPGRNLLVNGNFAINQRGYASGGALASGQYAHDRWKAYNASSTYTFTQTVPDTVVTVATSQYIQQLIEPQNIAGGSYVLSWQGTATCLIGWTPPGGSYNQLGPVTSGAVQSIPAGSSVVIYIYSGTCSTIQLEVGPVPTKFERRPIGLELALCQRYYELIGAGIIGSTGNAGYVTVAFRFAVPKRTTPTLTGLLTSLTAVSPGVASYSASAATYAFNQAIYDASGGNAFIGGFSGLPLGYPLLINSTNFISASAEL